MKPISTSTAGMDAPIRTTKGAFLTPRSFALRFRREETERKRRAIERRMQSLDTEITALRLQISAESEELARLDGEERDRQQQSAALKVVERIIQRVAGSDLGRNPGLQGELLRAVAVKNGQIHGHGREVAQSF